MTETLQLGLVPRNLERILKETNEKLETSGVLKDRQTHDVWSTLMSYLLQGENTMALPKRQDLQRHMRTMSLGKLNTFNGVIQRLDEILDVYIPPPDLGSVNVVDSYWDGRMEDDLEERKQKQPSKTSKRFDKPATKRTGKDWDTPRKQANNDDTEFAPEIVESSVFQIKSPERPATVDTGISKKEFFLLKANESVLMKTVEDQQTKIKHLQENVDSLEQRNVVLQEEIKSLARDQEQHFLQENVDSLEQRNVVLQEEIKSLARDQEQRLSVCTRAEREIKFLRQELGDKEHALELSMGERNTLLDRLSTVADLRLDYEPPSRDEIDDLNRPSQLSDKYNRLHDNEWSHAQQVLKVEFGETDRVAVITLLDMLYDSYSFCLDVTEAHTKCLTDQLLEPITKSQDNKERDKKKLESTTRRLLGDLKRSVGRQAVANVQTEFIQSFRQRKHGAYTDVKMVTLRPYVLKCVELCWFMVLQTPPLCLDGGSLVRAGEDFDRDSYRYYSLSGSIMDYIVWPALFTSRNGLILSRGVAQPKPEGVALRIASRGSSRDTLLKHSQTHDNYTDVKMMTLRPYVLKCVELCWFMVLHTPPLCLDGGSLVRAGEDFDRDSYRYYNLSGSIMDYIVWPALFTSRNGLILSRGVAQPKPEGVAMRIASRGSARDTLLKHSQTHDNYTDVKMMTLRPYVLKCVELCWFMVLQTPPLCLDGGSLVRAGEDFDRDSYRYYSLSGSIMDYIVWPALFTSRNGLILSRGVAQPKPEGVALRIASRGSARDT